MVLGVQVLDMGVFLGIILGIVVAYIHNRFCEKEFDGAFQIYGGSRLVFIILIPITVFSNNIELCLAFSTIFNFKSW